MIRKLLIRVLFCLLMSSCSNHTTRETSVNAASADTTAKRIGDLIELAPDSPQLSRIRVDDVEAERVPIDEVVAPGKIEANPNRISKIALPLAGRIRRVLVGLGDSVKESQPLILMDSPDIPALQAAYHRAEADIAQGQSASMKADADLQRNRDLFQNKAVAQKDVIAAETEATRAKSALSQAEATRDEIAQRIRMLGIEPNGQNQTLVVRATVSGKVVDINVAAGEYRNDASQPVMTLADLSTVWVSADVPESQIRLIRVGSPATITMSAFPGRTFSGRVKTISDVASAETRTIKVRAELPNPRGDLRPDMFAELRSDRGIRQLSTVPKTALLQQEGRDVVYVERAKGKFQEVPVTVASQGIERVAIEDGVHPGDRIVTSGAMLLRAAVR